MINHAPLRRHDTRIILGRFYHGHVEPVPDMYSGQIGPLIIYEKGVLNRRGLPRVSIFRIAVFRRCLVVFAPNPEAGCLLWFWHEFLSQHGETSRSRVGDGVDFEPG